MTPLEPEATSGAWRTSYWRATSTDAPSRSARPPARHARRIVVRLPEWRSRPGSLAGIARGRSGRRRMALPDLLDEPGHLLGRRATAVTSPARAPGWRSRPPRRRARTPAPRVPRASRRPRGAGSPTRPARARARAATATASGFSTARDAPDSAGRGTTAGSASKRDREREERDPQHRRRDAVARLGNGRHRRRRTGIPARRRSSRTS